jgi:hypothetical protein
MERQPLRPKLREATGIFWHYAARLAVPILVVTVIEYCVNLQTAHLQRWTFAHFAKSAPANLRVTAIEAGVVVLLIRLLTWAISLVLWATAFGVVASLMNQARKQKPLDLGSAYREVLTRTGLPTLLLRLYWQFSFLALIVGTISSLLTLGMTYLSQFLERRFMFFLTDFQLRALIVTLIIGFLYILYVYRFSLAVPLLLNSSQTATIDPLMESVERTYPYRWPIVGLSLAVAAAATEIDRYLPQKVWSTWSFASPWPYYAGTILIFFLTGLLYLWIFIFFCVLARDPGTVEALPEAAAAG